MDFFASMTVTPNIMESEEDHRPRHVVFSKVGAVIAAQMWSIYICAIIQLALGRDRTVHCHIPRPGQEGVDETAHKILQMFNVTVAADWHVTQA